MVKLLHAADLHLGARFRSLPPHKAARKRQQQLALLNRLEELCREWACDLVLLSGDLFDRPEGDGALAAALIRCLEAMAVPVFISPGNHDYICPQSPYETLVWPQNVHIFKRPLPESVSIPDLKVRVWGAGFSSMDCPGLLEGFRATGPEAWQIMALHGDPTGAGSCCCPVTRLQAEASGLHYLALGHIHKGGMLETGAGLCAWPGCPMGRGFDETGPKGVYRVTLSDGGVRADFVELGLGRYQDLTVPAGDNPERAILKLLPLQTQEDVYRVTLTGEAEALDLAALEEKLADRFFHLTLRDRTELPGDLWEQAGADTLEGLYFRLLRDAALEAGDADREILTLAARLSRRILDGQEVELP